jgi:hypothetical protein
MGSFQCQTVDKSMTTCKKGSQRLAVMKMDQAWFGFSPMVVVVAIQVDKIYS